MICVECEDKPVFTNFFEFAEHILYHVFYYGMNNHQLKNFALRTVNSKAYIEWRIHQHE
jgi:hypothetical protein